MPGSVVFPISIARSRAKIDELSYTSRSARITLGIEYRRSSIAIGRVRRVLYRLGPMAGGEPVSLIHILDIYRGKLAMARAVRCRR